MHKRVRSWFGCPNPAEFDNQRVQALATTGEVDYAQCFSVQLYGLTPVALIFRSGH